MDPLFAKSKSITAVTFGCWAQSNLPAFCSLCGAQVRGRWTYAVTEQWSRQIWFIQKIHRGAACYQCVAQLEVLRQGLTEKPRSNLCAYVLVGMAVLLAAYYLW